MVLVVIEDDHQNPKDLLLTADAALKRRSTRTGWGHSNSENALAAGFAYLCALDRERSHKNTGDCPSLARSLSLTSRCFAAGHSDATIE